MDCSEVVFDKAVCPFVSVDSGAIEDFCYRNRRRHCELDEGILADMGIIKPSSDGYVATNAYALLIPNPFPQAHIHCEVRRGRDGSLLSCAHDMGRGIMDQAKRAVEFIVNHICVGAIIRDVIREDVYEVPLEAIEAVIYNSVIHRDYERSDFPITVTVFDDRIEVVSPGRSLGAPEHPVYRNELVAGLFKHLKLTEGSGKGIQIAIDECRSVNLPEPQFVDDGEFFIATLYRGHSYQDRLSKGNLCVRIQ